MAKGFSQVRHVEYQTFAPTPSSASEKFLAAMVNEHGLESFHLDVVHGYHCAKLDHEIHVKLACGCEYKSDKTVRLNR